MLLTGAEAPPLRVLVTGAAGFVGAALTERLQADATLGSRLLGQLTVLDTRFPGGHGDAGIVRQVGGSIADRAVIDEAWGDRTDVVYHLASIPGGAAEQDYGLSRDVNLHGTMGLMEAAKAQVERGGRVPVFVFASTIGVFGSPLPDRVDDLTPLRPQTTYGTQKLVGETLLADFSRRHWLDGRALRLAGVLARPPARTGQLSAFLSDLIRELAHERRFVCPMSAHATTWAASIVNVVDNLLLAAQLDETSIAAQRTITLPALRFSMAELVEAIAAVHGGAVRALVDYAPDPRIEALFGHFPPLETQFAHRVGFTHDGDLATLVRRAFI